MFKTDIISSVWYIAQKYSINIAHASHIEKLALNIFDHTGIIHRLGERERNYLQVAAILHDVGKFIDLNQHEEQCYNIIHFENIIGFSDKDLDMAANVARYHGEDIPSLAHYNYGRLSYKDKIVVSKLASILKIADALDISSKQKVDKIEISIDNDEVYFIISSHEDTLLEEWSFKNNAEFFQEVMGIKPIIKTKR